MISLIIPVFNEENAIEGTIRDAREHLQTTGEAFEILVVNDGSTDDTLAKIHRCTGGSLRVITHPRNLGYGASMKTGIRHSTGDLLATVDADGTYPLSAFPKLIGVLRERQVDMVVGARTKRGVQIPLIRRPAKWIVNTLANILTGMRIPDLNSGMRVFRRELAERFMHLYPQKFSFTITLTLAALTNDYLVEYIPIDYHKRIGQSSLSQGMNGIRNFLNFLGLIVRITTYFRPLKFFALPSILLLIGGVTTILYTLKTTTNISDSGLLLLLTGLQIGLFGLLAEGVSRHRHHP